MKNQSSLFPSNNLEKGSIEMSLRSLALLGNNFIGRTWLIKPTFLESPLHKNKNKKKLHHFEEVLKILAILTHKIWTIKKYTGEKIALKFSSKWIWEQHWLNQWFFLKKSLIVNFGAVYFFLYVIHYKHKITCLQELF